MKKFFNDYMNNKFKLENYQKFGVFAFILFVSGLFGWIYEFIFYFLNSGMKTWYMRGGNFLPWINIYAIGAFLILIICTKFKKKPWLVFLLSVVITGLLEYFSGLAIYKLIGARYWDYNTEIWNFGNIGGFVCLRSVLFFGLSSFILMYVFNPVGIYLSQKMNKKVVITLSIFIIAIIFFDQIYNLIITKAFNLKNAIQIYKTYGIKYM
jgi:uncharacterized membrane protein